MFLERSNQGSALLMYYYINLYVKPFTPILDRHCFKGKGTQKYKWILSKLKVFGKLHILMQTA